MYKKQFNFKNISGLLSREEMKMIKGGYNHPIEGSPSCGTTDCFGTIDGSWTSKICTTNSSGNCECPISGGTACR